MAVGDFHLHVFLLHARQIDLRDEAVVLLEHVDLREPFCVLRRRRWRETPATGTRATSFPRTYPIELRGHLSQQREGVAPPTPPQKKKKKKNSSSRDCVVRERQLRHDLDWRRDRVADEAVPVCFSRQFECARLIRARLEQNVWS